MSAEKDVEVMLGDPRKAILSMVIPIVIAFLIGQINMFVDTMWCSSLGVNAVSAISLVSSLYFLVMGIGNGIGVGLNVVISRFIGAGDRESGEERLAQITVLMTIIGIVLTPILVYLMDPIVILIGGEEILAECRDYLLPMFILCVFTMHTGILSGAMRGEGASKRSSLYIALSAILNMVLDPLLIIVLDLGLMGASIATMLASVFTTVLMLRYYMTGRSYIALKLKGFKFNLRSTYDVMYVGIPQMLELNVMSLMNLILVSLVISTGGPEGLAIYNMPWRIVSLVMVFPQAFASAMVPVCSASIGQNDPERLKTGYYYTVKQSTLLGVVISIAVAILAPIIVYSFTYDASMIMYRDEMARVVRIYCLFMPFYGLIYVGSSMLSALKKSTYALVSAFVRNLVLIAIFVVASYHDMDWFYWGLTLGEIFGGVLMMVLAQWQYRKQYKLMVAVPA